ncbi:hypothetical protein MYRNA_72 [Mycobacterium phage Myrna]|uniref:Uncharacterized protein n=1 Tax=Mycobacterium phage Myrna TaxID=546805 RepID=B5LJ83_9CAUD|nr:gp72 [Mycobacterium phage Myrna]ACH62080.1 hypothetical protein MYRNA_72 [Mycobacterium phage Myrna]
MTLLWGFPEPGIGEEPAPGGAFVKKKTIYVQLFGGEQDGFEAELELDHGSRWPDMFYVYPVCRTGEIKDARDPELQKLLVDNLSILAYEFHSADPRDGVRGGKIYRYRRCESADKALTDPAV